MKFLYKVLRIKEWFNSKLIMQIGFFLMFAFCCGLNSKNFVKPFIIFGAYAITYFALGYIANDLSDIKSDQRAGKRNAFVEAGIGYGIALFILLSVLNIGIALIVSQSFIYICIILFGYLLGIFYSFKPFRFKERGVLGLIVASLCQRNLQLAIIPFLFNVDMLLFWGINLLSFINGIRYILIHQYIDYENDIKSGTTTFAINKRNLTKKIIISCFSIELVLIIVCFGWALRYQSFWLLLIPVVFMLIESSLYRMIFKSKESLFTSYKYVPLDFFYIFVIPVTFLVLIGTSYLTYSWICLLPAMFLVKPTYSMLKLYFGYLKFFISNTHFIHDCRRLWKITDTISGLHFINVIPVFEGDKDKESVDKLKSYAIVSACEVKMPFSALKPYLQGEVCRELVFDYDNTLIEKAMIGFQLKNKSMLHYFAVYIIPHKIFWVNRKKDAVRTIINCMAHSGEHRETLTINNVECKTQRLNKSFYIFAGLACSELYFRRKDCFMSVFPSYLVIVVFWLIIGVVGLFINTKLSLFSGAYNLMFCFACLIDRLLFIKDQGIINTITLNKHLYCCNYTGSRVPLFKKYGIYTDKIVLSANRQRNKLIYAICSMTMSFIVVYCLILVGVLV